MNTIWIILAGYAVLLLAVGAVAGIRYPKWAGWHWVDLPYYSLAAAAVVMFFAADQNIRLEKILGERDKLHQSWHANPNARPDVQLHPTAPVLIRQGYKGLKVAIDHGDICKYTPSLECQARIEIGKAVSSAFESFSAGDVSEPEEQARLEEDFCSRAYQLVDSLDGANPLNAGAYSLLKAAMSRQAKQHEASGLVADQLATEIAEAQKQLQSRLQTSGSDLDISPIMKAHGEFAVYLFHMAGSCAERPSDQINAIKQLDAWQKESERRSAVDSTLRHAAEDAAKRLERTPAQQLAKAIKDGMWPFILLLALALKFGKAVADVTEKRARAAEAKLQAAEAQNVPVKGRSTDEVPSKADQ